MPCLDFPGLSFIDPCRDQIHDIFHEYTDIIETVALDEAYLDVTQNKKHLTIPFKWPE